MNRREEEIDGTAGFGPNAEKNGEQLLTHEVCCADI